jgi:hypothetical protein
MNQSSIFIIVIIFTFYYIIQVKFIYAIDIFECVIKFIKDQKNGDYFLLLKVLNDALITSAIRSIF